MLPAGRSDLFVGRAGEVGLLNQLVGEVAGGRGHAVWVEGEPGIGKSSLLATALSGRGRGGCETAWCVADELSQLLPLRTIMRCFAGLPTPFDSAMTEISGLLQARAASGMLGGVDPVTAAIERVLSLVDRLCAVKPLILVIDDLQWADDASLLAWHQLALGVDQQPLLLVAGCHPAPQRAIVDQLRSSVLDRGGVQISLGPLGRGEVSELVAGLVGGPPGPNLRQLAARASGNPLYVREIVAGLLGERRVTVGTSGADVAEPAGAGAPISIGSAIGRRLDFLSPAVLSTLRTATVLGAEFSVTDLATVLGRPPTDLMGELGEAQAGGVVVESGAGLAFGHQLIWQALYERMPVALRVALHRHAAQALADAGAPVEQVAEHLLTSAAADAWVLRWTAPHARALVERSPQMAAVLLSRVAPLVEEDDSFWHAVWSCQLEAQFRLGRHAEAEACAGRLLAGSTDPVEIGEVSWLLARVLVSTGRNAEAVPVIQGALADTRLPAMWQARMHALHTVFLRDVLGDLDAAEAAAGEALALGENAADPFAVGSALCVRWTVAAVRRQYADALKHIDAAIAVLGEDTEHPDLRASALEDRIFTLQNLDRLAEADACLNEARRYAARSGDPRAALHIGAAVHNYWTGRWDDALAELASLAPDSPEISHFGLRERGPLLLYHGVSALIAVCRDDRAAAARHLAAGFALPLETVSAWENADFLLAARALDAERRGDLAAAVSQLATILETRPGQMTLVHQWLPELVRLAIAVGDASTARAALQRCEAEAAREQVPARAAAAAARCRCLRSGDATALRAAADHYREVGRPVEWAQTLEELAALLAAQGDNAAARASVKQASDVYSGLAAEWLVHRAYSRLHVYGIRRGVRGRRRRATIGWEALTRTELSIAHLVGEGRSNLEIAAELYLARGTVQCHISHILAKLGAHSRLEIAREVLSHQRGSADRG